MTAVALVAGTVVAWAGAAIMFGALAVPPAPLVGAAFIGLGILAIATSIR